MKLTLEVLNRSFERFRKSSKQRGKGAKYPLKLRVAVQEFKRQSPGTKLEEVASAIGVSKDTVKRWLQDSKPIMAPQPFQVVEIPVMNSSHHGLRILSGDLAIEFQGSPELSDVVRLIKLLTAG